MIIHSPVGRFPFEVSSARLHGGRIEIEGAIGAWPTKVEIEPRDLPRIAARVIPRQPAAVVGLATAALVLMVRARSRS